MTNSLVASKGLSNSVLSGINSGPGALKKMRNRLKWHIRNTLSARQKQVMEYYLNGMTEREIARVLGVTQQVVNIYKWRALKKLQKVVAIDPR
ncbi:MAG: LuxR C-terminal-related transcriptional regulator [Candidatus Zixiibacteriota bacterium]